MMTVELMYFILLSEILQLYTFIVNSPCYVTDLPDVPTAPCVRDVHSTGCTVTYQSIVVEGGTAVIGYILQYKSTDAQSWVPLSRHLITDTRVKIRELQPGTEHEFRVAAVNLVSACGVDNFSPSSAAITTDQVKPVQPGRPVVRAVSMKSVALDWTMPGNDTGTFQYIIRVRYRFLDTDRKMFVVTERKAGSLVQHSLSVDMEREIFYDFAVAAVNAAGVGPYSVPSERVRFTVGKSQFLSCYRHYCPYSSQLFSFVVPQCLFDQPQNCVLQITNYKVQ